jgi:hypothetical protein
MEGASAWCRFISRWDGSGSEQRDQIPTDNLALLLNHYRNEIEAAASANYDREYCEGADIVVTARDLGYETWDRRRHDQRVFGRRGVSA